MCGIAGIVATQGFDPHDLMAMTHLVKHRGPDGFGFGYFSLRDGEPGECFHDANRLPAIKRPRLGFGSRRLAILDLSDQGAQPMQTNEGIFSITYNGEIYNFLELRSQLESLGHRFKSRTDTEVVLRAYEQWGDACVDHFHGMWSFAIYDRLRNRLFCSRDRFGIKPFYYFATPSLLLFGSEIKQIATYPGFVRSVNELVAYQYLAQGLLDQSDETFFDGVRQLQGGHSLFVDLSRSEIAVQVHKFWELPLAEDAVGPEHESIVKVKEYLHTSVSQHMRSDVPVGSCLSGGLDSSSIVSLASAGNPSTKLHSFSACFDQAELDERSFIRQVVDSRRLNSHLVFPSPKEFWEELGCLIWHHDEPLGGASAYAQWCVMRRARQARIPVLLDGQGGDEIFCGYRKFYPFYLWHLLTTANPRAFSEGAMWAFGTGRINWSWKHAKKYFSGGPLANDSLVSRTCSDDFMERSRDYRRENIGPRGSLRERQKEDITRFSLPTLLHCEDRNSMAHSVEARVPMLDHELVTFALNCPPELKLRNGITKWVLRQAMEGILIDGVRLRRTKLGFEAPQKQWMLADARATIRSVANSPDLNMSHVLSAQKIRAEFTKFLDRMPGALPDTDVFRLLNLELWSRTFAVS